MGRLTRAAAFLAKEGAQVVHQPRLLALLTFGPFAVLLLFGAGFSTQAPRFRTVVVAEPDSTAAELVERFVDDLDQFVDYEGLADSREEAIERLEDGELDVVAVLPADPFETVRRDRRATIEIIHDAIDPVAVTAIDVVARVAADEINRRALTRFIRDNRGSVATLEASLPLAEASLDLAALLLRSGRRDESEAVLRQVQPALEALRTQLGRGTTIDDALPSATTTTAPDRQPDVVDRALGQLDELERAPASAEERLAQVERAREALRGVRGTFAGIGDVAPGVLVRPFRTVTGSVLDEPLRPLDFYAPAALVLLLQHLAVTFPALSIVRERSLGTTELFAAAPLSPGEALAGKATSFFLLGLAVAVVLGLAVQLLGVPLAGSPMAQLLVVTAVLLGSLGLGFVISGIARSDTQAVQLTMILLLASFFFSGFFLPLDRLGGAALVVSELLPSTHGITMARDVTLRGRPLTPEALLPPALLAVGAFTAAWWLLARRFRQA